MIKIYHNPRCIKSRQGVAFLKEQSVDFEEIRYLDQGLSKEELEGMLKKMNIKAIDLVRKNEAVWKSDFKGEILSEADIIEAMISYPKLMERPVVINNNKAVIGRPTEKINEVL